MAGITIHLEHREAGYTVSEMRRELARVLAPLAGNQEITFTFSAGLPTMLIIEPVKAVTQKRLPSGKSRC